MLATKNEEIIYNEFYEKTKDCGRTQFVKLLMEKEREIERLKSLLKCDYEDNQEIMADIIKEKQELIDYLKEQIKLCKKAQQLALKSKNIEQVGFLNLRIAIYQEILSKIEKE